jgi:hypothetical protein
MAYRNYKRKSSRSGCLKGVFGGCFSMFIFFVLIISMLSSIEFPEFDFGYGEKVNYTVEMDSLTTEKIINASFSWKFVSNTLTKKKYNLTFRLLANEVRKAVSLIDRISGMTFEELGLDPRYEYRDPEIQAQYVWARIYQIVYERSSPQLKTISEGFNEIFRNENMPDNDKLLFVISFVQNIKYDRPGGTLDLFAPLGALAKMFGDCDTKAILLYVLLERMGIDCAMMWSQKYKHAMLGVNISTRGNYKISNGKKYYFLETTYPGWSIGDLPPDFKNKRFWFVNEVDSKETMVRNKEQSPIDNREESSKRESRPTPAAP